jgi:hypothetical protein
MCAGGPRGTRTHNPRIKGSWNETAWGSTWDYTGQLSVSTYSSGTGQQQFVPRTMPRAPLLPPAQGCRCRPDTPPVP